ncbi:MAG: EF-hand domain-containing protein [Planctomycetes bacterium]|nr:EF-hand domain-containing protein [Planctomycetota bacterium]
MSAFRLTAIGTAMLILAVGHCLAADDAPAPDALADLIVDGPKPPLRLRLVVTCEGKHWRDYAADTNSRREVALFAQLDSNDNGTLSEQEARRLPADAWTQPDGQRGPAPFVAFNFRAMDADDDDSVTRAEFSNYVAIPAATAFRFRQIERTQLAPGRRLFSALDSDRNGWLSRDEWSDPPNLFRNDLNGDRLLTSDELKRNEARAFGPEFIATARTKRGLSTGPLTCRVDSQFGGTPDAVIDVRFGTTAHDASIRFSKRGEIVARFQVAAQTRGRIVLNIHGRRIELRLVPSHYDPVRQLRAKVLRDFDGLATASRSLPLDRNVPVSIRTFAALGDRDANGALSRAELQFCLDGYAAARTRAQGTTLRLAIVPESQNLERLVDGDLDRRLSRREFSQLPSLLNDLAEDRKRIHREDIPPTLSLLLQRGPASGEGIPSATGAAPAWFVRSDRNRDGDIDRDEFLGTPQDFQRLNTNGDEWIDRDEAIQADLAAASRDE